MAGYIFKVYVTPPRILNQLLSASLGNDLWASFHQLKHKIITRSENCYCGIQRESFITLVVSAKPSDTLPVCWKRHLLPLPLSLLLGRNPSPKNRLLAYYLLKANQTPGPSVTELITKAVSASKERKGVSLAALKKVLAAGGYDVEKSNSRIPGLKSLVSKGTWVQTKGTGASGSFKLSKKPDVTKEKAPKKKSAAKPKKPAAKKPASAAKKPKQAAAVKKSPKKARKPAAAAAKKAAKSPKSLQPLSPRKYLRARVKPKR
ncbi:zinc transporter ZIP3 [Platysternon megacephalum]|uniref:Zinc transporter ZIP3 n=1 Tax=Platysternon megacephalum TaxID=55544 RepID=A0A4D9EMK7_9SAUR|nr:zinc transporter ZIP3 [Platysternon megacephalum]